MKKIDKSDSMVTVDSSEKNAVSVKMDENLFDTVEPFIDMDMKALRQKFSKDSLFEQSMAIVRSEVGDVVDKKVLTFLARMHMDMYILKTAYVEKTRYSEPRFVTAMPEQKDKEDNSEILIDFSKNITGGNWWGPEAEGRWAGPENESSLLFPKLENGTYRLSLQVVSEIESGLLDNDTLISLDNKKIIVVRENKGFPTTLTATVEITDAHLLPFHSMKFSFAKLRSPSDYGKVDTRRLAIRVSKVKFSKVAL